MSDPRERPGRPAGVEAAIAGVARPARWLARFLGIAAATAAVAGVALWWFGFRDDLDESVGEAVVAAVVLLVPAGWLLNARVALRNLADLPNTVQGLARRGSEHLRGRPAPGPDRVGGAAGAARTVYRTVREGGELLGSRALVAQLAAPTFWLFTGLALLAVPLLALCAVVAGLLDLFS